MNLTLLLLLVSLLVGHGVVAPAVVASVPAVQDQQVSWDRYDVEFAIQPNGDVLVTETQAIDFQGTFRRASRDIPLDRTTAVTDVQVGEPGKPYRADSNSTNGFTVSETDDNLLRVEWFYPQTSDAKRTFVLSYRLQGALAFYDGGDQFRREAIYGNSDSPRAGVVRQATITVRFPQDAPADQVRAETNPESGAGEGRLVDPRTVVFETQNLPAERYVDIRVQFPHGMVTASPPPWQKEADQQDVYDQNTRPIVDFLLLLVGLAIPLAGLAVILMTWYTRGRDPVVSGVPPELDQPPSDLPPGLVGTLVDEQADMQDVLATLLDLARRDVLRIEEKTDPTLVGSSRDFTVTQIDPQPSGLSEYERTVLTSLLPGGTATTISAMKGRFTAHIPMFQQQLYDAVTRAGLFTANPELVRRRYRKWAKILLVVAAVGWVLSSIIFSGRASLGHVPFIALGLVGLVLAFSARAMPARTRAGALEAARWRAFGAHLSKQDRPNSDKQHEIERYLPYSVALGVDRDWLRKFQTVGAPAPHWYTGPGGSYRGGSGGLPPVIVLPGGYSGGPARGGGSSQGGSGPSGPGGGGWGIPSPGDASDSAARGAQGWSDALVDLLNTASDAMARGGGSGGWSGGGGGWSGGGGGGGGRGGGSFG